AHRGTLPCGRSCRFVHQADDHAGDRPLHEVGHGLLERELEADVEVDVIVQDKGADGKNSDEYAEASAFPRTASTFVPFGVDHSKHQETHDRGGHADRKVMLDALRRAVHPRVGAISVPEEQAENQEAKEEIGNERSQGGQENALVVHADTPLRARTPSSLSNDSSVPAVTNLMIASSGKPSCVRTILVWPPWSKNSMMTRVVAGPRFTW